MEAPLRTKTRSVKGRKSSLRANGHLPPCRGLECSSNLPPVSRRLLPWNLEVAVKWVPDRCSRYRHQARASHDEFAKSTGSHSCYRVRGNRRAATLGSGDKSAKPKNSCYRVRGNRRAAILGSGDKSAKSKNPYPTSAENPCVRYMECPHTDGQCQQ